MPLSEQYYVAVDRQLKSGFGTYEAAEKAAKEIKKRYPNPQVSVFDAKKLLMFPGYLIWDLAKYCNSQEGRLGKVGMFGVLSLIFGFSALVWFGLWALGFGL